MVAMLHVRALRWTLSALVVALGPAAAAAEEPPAKLRLGAGLRAGGRYDTVRMCVATGAGVRGGPAADVAFLLELPLRGTMSLQIDVPVMRPVLFAAAFEMLQFEPDAVLKFRRGRIVFGPSLGAILHYGPDFHSESSGPGRRPSFFALGPRLGGVVGYEWLRPHGWFDMQFNLHPYVSPLIPTAGGHDAGVVVGGALEADFYIH
jgi:hypothetical protein